MRTSPVLKAAATGLDAASPGATTVVTALSDVAVSLATVAPSEESVPETWSERELPTLGEVA